MVRYQMVKGVYVINVIILVVLIPIIYGVVVTKKT